jgi:hypothetical protein
MNLTVATARTSHRRNRARRIALRRSLLDELHPRQSERLDGRQSATASGRAASAGQRGSNSHLAPASVQSSSHGAAIAFHATGHCGFRGAGSEGLLLSPWERARRGPRNRRPQRTSCERAARALVSPWPSGSQRLVGQGARCSSAAGVRSPAARRPPRSRKRRRVGSRPLLGRPAPAPFVTGRACWVGGVLREQAGAGAGASRPAERVGERDRPGGRARVVVASDRRGMLVRRGAGVVRGLRERAGRG